MREGLSGRTKNLWAKPPDRRKEVQKPTCLALVALPGGRLEPGLKLPFVQFGSRSNHCVGSRSNHCVGSRSNHTEVSSLCVRPAGLAPSPPSRGVNIVEVALTLVLTAGWAPGMCQSPYLLPCGHGPLPGQSGLLSPGPHLTRVLESGCAIERWFYCQQESHIFSWPLAFYLQLSWF